MTPRPARHDAGAGDVAPDFASARQRFLEAAAARGAELSNEPHPCRGLQGEPLATDFAWCGPLDAPHVLLSLSGTHGIEGLYGSAAQAACLGTLAGRRLPKGVAVAFVHAVNPWGFSWMRRTDHENIDVNRNFVDFAAPPHNDAYDALHALLLPDSWGPQTDVAVAAALQARARETGLGALARALTGGQYRHADGIFYGGAAPSWSRQVLVRWVDRHLLRVRTLCVLDHHTGLGPAGKVELICRHAPGSQAEALARDWWGPAVASTARGESVSEPVEGSLRMGLVERCAQATGVAVALEVGTQPPQAVLGALIADNWLHARGDRLSSQGDSVRHRMRAAFCVDTPAWRERSVADALDVFERAVQGLAAMEHVRP